MDKSKKKKVTGAAVAAGAATVGAAFINSKGEQVAMVDPIEPQDVLIEGEELPEIVVTGNAPMADGGELPEVTIAGTAAVTAQIPTDDATVAPAAEMAEVATDNVPQMEGDGEFDTAEDMQVDDVPEEEYHDEFDDSDELLAQTETKESDGSLIEEFIDKAEGFLSIGGNTETEMPDFDNAANVNEFTGM